MSSNKYYSSDGIHPVEPRRTPGMQVSGAECRYDKYC